MQSVTEVSGVETSKDPIPRSESGSAEDDYDEREVESAHELEELVRLRAEMTWSVWKAHPRFKRDRLIREARRRFGDPCVQRAITSVREPANDAGGWADADGMLAQDETFGAVCDARRDGWVDALETRDMAAEGTPRKGDERNG